MSGDAARPAVVHPQGLEQAVAEEEAGVGGIDADLAGRDEPAVPVGQAHPGSRAPRAVRKARALAALSANSCSGSESATMPQPA